MTFELLMETMIPMMMILVQNLLQYWGQGRSIGEQVCCNPASASTPTNIGSCSLLILPDNCHCPLLDIAQIFISNCPASMASWPLTSDLQLIASSCSCPIIAIAHLLTLPKYSLATALCSCSFAIIIVQWLTLSSCPNFPKLFLILKYEIRG